MNHHDYFKQTVPDLVAPVRSVAPAQHANPASVRALLRQHKLFMTCLFSASSVMMLTAMAGLALQGGEELLPKEKTRTVLAAMEHKEASQREAMARRVAARKGEPIKKGSLADALASSSRQSTSVVSTTPQVAPVIVQPPQAPAPAVQQPVASQPVASGATWTMPVTTTTGAPQPTALVRLLDNLERDGKFEDAIVEAYHQAPTLSPVERMALLGWLHAREASPDMPVLFTIARVHEAAGNLDEASKWYIAATVINGLDASRTTLPNAPDAVNHLAKQFDTVRNHLRADPSLRRVAAGFALSLEERLKDRKPANWIAGAAFASGAEQTAQTFVPEGEWQAKREQYRKTLRAYVEGR